MNKWVFKQSKHFGCSMRFRDFVPGTFLVSLACSFVLDVLLADRFFFLLSFGPDWRLTSFSYLFMFVCICEVAPTYEHVLACLWGFLRSRSFLDIVLPCCCIPMDVINSGPEIRNPVLVAPFKLESNPDIELGIALRTTFDFCSFWRPSTFGLRDCAFGEQLRLFFLSFCPFFLHFLFFPNLFYLSS